MYFSGDCYFDTNSQPNGDYSNHLELNPSDEFQHYGEYEDHDSYPLDSEYVGDGEYAHEDDISNGDYDDMMTENTDAGGDFDTEGFNYEAGMCQQVIYMQDNIISFNG